MYIHLEKGLAQRGGSVQAHIRLGDVYSPTIPKRSANGLLSLEITETFGYLDFINADTVSAVSDTIIASVDAKPGKSDKDETAGGTDTAAKSLESKLGPNMLIVDAQERAAGLGVAKAVNIFMIGVLCGMDGRLSEFLSESDIEAAIRVVVRHQIEKNIIVFRKGLEYGRTKKSG